MRLGYAFKLIGFVPFVLGCTEPNLLPLVRAEVHTDESVIPIGALIRVTVRLANDGPGEVLGAVACPAFTVRDSAGTRVGPGWFCLLIPPRQFSLRAGQVHTVDVEWNGNGFSGGGLSSGVYSLAANAGAVTPDHTQLTIGGSPTIVQIVP